MNCAHTSIEMKSTIYILLLVTTIIVADEGTESIRREDNYLAGRPANLSVEKDGKFESKRSAAISKDRINGNSGTNLEFNHQKDINAYRIPILTLDSSVIEKTDSQVFDGENQYAERAEWKSGTINRLTDQTGGYASSINSFQFNKKDGYIYEKPKVPFEEGPRRTQKPAIATTSLRPIPQQVISGYQPSKIPAKPSAVQSTEPTQSATYRPTFPSYQPPQPTQAAQSPSYRPLSSLTTTSSSILEEQYTQTSFSSSSFESSSPLPQQPQNRPGSQISNGYSYEKQKKTDSQNSLIISVKPSKVPSRPIYVSPPTKPPLYRPISTPQTPSIQPPGITLDQFPVPQIPVKNQPNKFGEISSYRPVQDSVSQQPFYRPSQSPSVPAFTTPKIPSRPIQKPSYRPQETFASQLPFNHPTPPSQIPSKQRPGTFYTPRPVTSPQKITSAVPAYSPSSGPSIIAADKPPYGSSISTGYIYDKPKKTFVEVSSNFSQRPSSPAKLPQGPSIQIPSIQTPKEPAPQKPIFISRIPSYQPSPNLEQRPSQTPSQAAQYKPASKIPNFFEPQKSQYKPSPLQTTKTQFPQPSPVPSQPSYQRPSSSQLPEYKPIVQPSISIPPSTQVPKLSTVYIKLPAKKTTYKPSELKQSTSQDPLYRPIQQITPETISQLPSQPPFEPQQIPERPSKRPILVPGSAPSGKFPVVASIPSNQFPLYKPQQPAYPSKPIPQRPNYAPNIQPLQPFPQAQVTPHSKEQTGYIYEKPKKPFNEISQRPSFTTKKPPTSQASTYRPTSPTYRPPQIVDIQQTSSYQKPSETPTKPSSKPNLRLFKAPAPQAPENGPPQTPALHQPSLKPSSPPNSNSPTSNIPASQRPFNKPFLLQKPSFIPSIPSYRPPQSFEYVTKTPISNYYPSKVPKSQQPSLTPLKPSSISSIPSFQPAGIPSPQLPSYRPIQAIPSYPPNRQQKPLLTPQVSNPKKATLITSVQTLTPQSPSLRPTQNQSYPSQQPSYKPSLISSIQDITPQKPSSISSIPSYQPPPSQSSDPPIIRPTSAPKKPLYQFQSYQRPFEPASKSRKPTLSTQSPLLPSSPAKVVQSVQPFSGYNYEKPRKPFIETQNNNPLELPKRPNYVSVQPPSTQQPVYRPISPSRKLINKPTSVAVTKTIKKPITLETTFGPSLPSNQPIPKQPGQISLKPVKPSQTTAPQTPLYRPPSLVQIPAFQSSQPDIYRPSPANLSSANEDVYEKLKTPAAPSYKPTIISQVSGNQHKSTLVSQRPSFRPNPTPQFPSYQYPKVPTTSRAPSFQFLSNQPAKKPIYLVSQQPSQLPIPSQIPISIYPKVKQKPQQSFSRPSLQPSTSKPSYPSVTLQPIQKPVYEAPGYIPPLIDSQTKAPSTFKPSVTKSKTSTYSPKSVGPVVTTPKPFIYPSSTYRPAVTITTTFKPIPSIITQKQFVYIPPTYKPFTKSPSSFKPFTSAPTTNKPNVPIFTTVRPVSFEPSTYKTFSSSTTIKPSTYRPFIPLSTTPKSYTYATLSRKPSFKPVAPASTEKQFTNSPSAYKPSTFVTPDYKPFVPQSTTQKTRTNVIPSKTTFTSKPFTYGPSFQPSVGISSRPFTYGPSFKPSVNTTRKQFPYEPSLKPSISTTSKPLIYSPSTYKAYRPVTSTPIPQSSTSSAITPPRETFRSFVTSTARPSTTTEDRHYLPPISDGYFYPRPNITFDFE